MQAEPEFVIAYTDGVRWQWLRGHSGVPLNARVDRLAREFWSVSARLANAANCAGY